MKNWYAVQTKPRRESDAETNLLRQGFEVYLPRIQVSRRRRGKLQPVVEPLFPRYLFVHVDPNEETIAPIRSTVGVSQLVRFGQTLVSIPAEIVDYLRTREDEQSGCYVRESDQFSQGDAIEILDGPFAGLQGVYESASSEERVIVLLDILGDANRLSLSSAQVLRISD